MAAQVSLPDGLTLARTTPTFDEKSVPGALLCTHRVAEGVWGRVIVAAGSLRFVFEETSDEPILVEAGGHVVIPPGTPHHLELDGPVSFAVEFHK